MKNRSKIAIAVVLVLGVAAVIAGVAASDGGETREFQERLDARPWVDANGMVDVTKMPRLEGVADHTGALVGYVETRHTYGDEFVYPQPVIDADGNLVGHIGENGFWALGTEEPVIEDAYTVVEEYDADGQLIFRQVIGPGSNEGEEGPQGNTD